MISSRPSSKAASLPGMLMLKRAIAAELSSRLAINFSGREGISRWFIRR
ncbi:hypothetical protein I6M54_10150 [Shewanella algae]|nr:hypothetical protein [Shewanella algae]MBO2595202.1 hypothetical protein [Shewanella algae]MBO2666556.1 hypothetical protein [Shewanella algae]